MWTRAHVIVLFGHWLDDLGLARGCEPFVAELLASQSAAEATPTSRTTMIVSAKVLSYLGKRIFCQWLDPGFGKALSILATVHWQSL